MTQRPQSADCRLVTDLNNKSMLQSRALDRMTGSKFFHDNRTRTCSYIVQNGDHFTAVPFYDKRNNREYPTRSEWT